jgi:hypothetical protein
MILANSLGFCYLNATLIGKNHNLDGKIRGAETTHASRQRLARVRLGVSATHALSLVNARGGRLGAAATKV